MNCWLIFVFAACNIEYIVSATDEDVKNHQINVRTTAVERTSSHFPKPKMVGEEVIDGQGPSFEHRMMMMMADLPSIINIDSKAAIFTGYCSSESPFEFIVGGKIGRGVIGTPSVVGSESTRSAVTSVEIAVDSRGKREEHLVVHEDKVFPNFFLAKGFDGLPFDYAGMTTTEGTMMRVNCSNSKEAVDVVVFVEDRNSQVIKATVTYDPSVNEQMVELVDVASAIDLQAESIIPVAKQKDATSSSSSASNTIEGSSTPTSITLSCEHNDAKDDVSSPDVTLVQLVVEDADGFLIPKTIPVTSSNRMAGRSRKLKEGVSNTIRLDDSFIDENGDLNLKFEQLGDDELDITLLHARIGIKYSGCVSEQHQSNTDIKDIVDMKAMLHGNEPTLIVHGGWFRRAMEKHGIANDNECDWEPILVDAMTKDPEYNYITIGRLESPVSARVMDDNDDVNSGGLRRLSLIELNKRRDLLRAMPSSEELTISDDMRQGRNPKLAQSDDASTGRRLSGSSKKILVHGYCSGDVWDPSHFTNSVSFLDPGANRSNNQFALLIHEFAEENNIESCGIIAHSQGGLAALHLYEYYWSCLNEAQSGGSHLIQSIGSPYKGSPLQGSLAAIGDIFGILCGVVGDLTTDGAVAWLNDISSEARSQVYYATTSVKDRWFSWDACNLASDLLLSDPEDGVVEKSRGQLSGGNNLGHYQGYCHTSGMSNPSQTDNLSFNRYFDRNAKY